jgi:hypothetical protein
MGTLSTLLEPSSRSDKEVAVLECAALYEDDALLSIHWVLRTLSIRENLKRQSEMRRTAFNMTSQGHGGYQKFKEPFLPSLMRGWCL